MSYRLQYIGPTQTFKAVPFNQTDMSFIDIKIEKNKQYIVELQQDGSTMILNGQLIMPPDATIWIIFPSFGGRIPYSPEAILNQWRLL